MKATAALALVACTAATAPPLTNHGGSASRPDPEAQLARFLAHRGLDVRCLIIDRAAAADVASFEVRELHEPPCPGNPGTLPVVGWFRVSARAIDEYDRSAETWKPVATW